MDKDTKCSGIIIHTKRGQYVLIRDKVNVFFFFLFCSFKFFKLCLRSFVKIELPELKNMSLSDFLKVRWILINLLINWDILLIGVMFKLKPLILTVFFWKSLILTLHVYTFKKKKRKTYVYICFHIFIYSNINF